MIIGIGVVGRRRLEDSGSRATSRMDEEEAQFLFN